MTNKIKAATITATFFAILSSGVIHADEVTVSGNGQNSDNTVFVSESSTNVVSQENNAFVSNDVVVASNTGENEAIGNTGGEVNITTGDTTTLATVENKLNKNYAESSDCCDQDDLDVVIKDNGKNSDNDVAVFECEVDVLDQENKALVKNDVEVGANTGINEANGNTMGDGDVGGDKDPSITTGGVDVIIGVSTKANLNVATADEDCCNEGSVNLTIKNNGKNSKNKVKTFSKVSNFLFQKNFALLGNFVGVGGNTGGNQANGNTGGEVNISTGHFSAFVSIFNKLNKNFAF